MKQEVPLTFAERVCRLVKKIPAGRVATYGQIATLAGTPRAARMVGWILRHSHVTVPWQRVVNRTGRISIVHEHLTARMQAELLQKERIDVQFRDDSYWIDLTRFLWHPRRRAGVV